MNRRSHMRVGPSSPDMTFICEHCNHRVPGTAPGTEHRSHCPHCLRSLHVEAGQAGAATHCQGQMEPVAVSTESSGAWSLVHRCRRCATTHVHSIAVDDNGAALLTIATRRPTRPAPTVT